MNLIQQLSFSSLALTLLLIPAKACGANEDTVKKLEATVATTRAEITDLKFKMDQVQQQLVQLRSQQPLALIPAAVPVIAAPAIPALALGAVAVSAAPQQSIPPVEVDPEDPHLVPVPLSAEQVVQRKRSRESSPRT